MRCLYETLKVGRDAEAQTIKKSYRAQALVLHPGVATATYALCAHLLLHAYL